MALGGAEVLRILPFLTWARLACLAGASQTDGLLVLWTVCGVVMQLQQAEAASKNVVYIPLSPEARQAFNETAAIEFFKGVEGLEYGYQVTNPSCALSHS